MPLPPYALPSWYRYCGAAVAPVDTARDLGVRLDAQLTLDEHMDSVVRSCFYQLHQLHSIRRSVTGVQTCALPIYVLHWLPVPQRITFKIALTVFDCARGQCPATSVTSVFRSTRSLDVHAYVQLTTVI